MQDCCFTLMTSQTPGAIAILQLHGEVESPLQHMTSFVDWPVGHARLVQFDGIDEGIAVRLSRSIAQLMPHGGPRVVQQMRDRLVEFGVQQSSAEQTIAAALYPEAEDDLEAIAMHAVSRAASPLAIDALLGQPQVWRSRPVPTSADLDRSQRLNRLIDPPLVVLAGPPNVGKSTLSNALLGRSMSIAIDLPGTTRDYTMARIDIGGLVVNWHDTPGIRDTADSIESSAIDLASRLINQADLLIVMTDAEHSWPRLQRHPDIRVASKADLSPREDADVCVSAVTGLGLADFVRMVRDSLVSPDDLSSTVDRPWMFDQRLLRIAHGSS